MTRSLPSARHLAPLALVAVASVLGGCSGGSHFESDYVSPIAATPASQPAVPLPSGGGAGPARRMPLLPPVPGEESSNGLPPVTTASLLPPDVR